ncbi:arabinan endo-1,5-alpha-L-arabinosidase [Sphingomonas sp. M1-B02]|uniref:arabinan endo-1,5-alpha-L-arabinosidase n=1 Tax=Sphingomonas sp. M1-B02 TaxID=3114300 RepID=UPI0022409797|nr:arabinan endo-1,5-alpha-L-arabinosidase [Sphingomonas sp. S6-11]UZK67662.1 arabinan endo-1,5-alpha-L-arabinosidase [Sphingomonas sp. S6-11]
MMGFRPLFATCASIALLAASGASAQTATPAKLNDRLSGDLAPTHDPVIAREGDTYYVFGTGHGQRLIETRSSPNLARWTAGAPLFTAIPEWGQKAVPGTKGMWAPDIAFVNGRWRLYYSLSTFGSNRSAIGMFTSPTLDPKAPNYGWRDEGLVVASGPSDDFNAIDPNFVIDREGKHWLSLGSFWTGIKLFRLDPATGKPLNPSEAPLSIARRPAPAGGPAPVEAPFIVPHGDYYYLFVSYDYCCKGVNSTYYTVVGRSKAIGGPYLGKDGSSLMDGKGTVFLRADLEEQQRFRGPGHPGWLRDKDGREYVVYHAYDKESRGAPTLRIAPVRWGADGWPIADY